MCGIWGIVTLKGYSNKNIIKKMIKQLFILSEVRGKDAAGVAILSYDKLNVFKRPQTADVMIRGREYRKFIEENLSANRLENGVAIIGHSRMVTNGTSKKADNNQPVNRGNMVTVHNGIIVNVDKLWEDNPQFKRLYDVDTEIFAELCEQYRQSMDIEKAVCKVYGDIRGMASTLSLFADIGVLVAATNNGSLYLCTSADGVFTVFASEKLILERFAKKQAFSGMHFPVENIQQMQPMEAMIIESASGKRKHFNLDKNKIYDLKFEKVKRKIRVDKGKDADSITPMILDEAKYQTFDINTDLIRKLRRCTCCVLPETMPFIKFDRGGMQLLPYISKTKISGEGCAYKLG